MQSRFLRLRSGQAYDPEIGRFLQPGGACPERSRRVLNNPLRYTDPTGRCGVSTATRPAAAPCERGGTAEYYLADGLGSTTALTDDTGVVTDTYEYDVFGNIRAETGASALRQPRQHLVEVFEYPEVAGVGDERGAAVRDGLGLVSPHRDGHGPIRLAVPEIHLGRDVFQQEVPGASKQQHFVCLAATSLTECLSKGVAHHCSHLGSIDDALVRRRQSSPGQSQNGSGEPSSGERQIPHRQVDEQGNAPPKCEGQTRGPGQARSRLGRIGRSPARHDARLRQSVRDLSCAGCGVGTAPGLPEHGEAFDAELVGHLGNVVRPIADATTLLNVRATEPRTVERDEPHTAALGRRAGNPCLKAAARKPVKVEDWCSGRVPVLGIADLAAVAELDGPIAIGVICDVSWYRTARAA